MKSYISVAGVCLVVLAAGIFLYPRTAEISLSSKKEKDKDKAAAHFGAKQDIPLFQSSDVLKVDIKNDFPSVNVSGAPQNSPRPGQLTYANDKGEPVTLDITLEARGGGRSRWCNFAPLRLRIGKDKENKEELNASLKGTIFEHSHRTFRTITHCKSTTFPTEDGNWNNVVLTEYTSYQILMASGLPALDTRLADAVYYDYEGKKFDEGLLLILENDSDMADRLKLDEIDRHNFPNVSPTNEVTFALGLRLIASEADHQFNGTQNSFFVGKKTDAGYSDVLEIPYDFVLSPQYFPYTTKVNTHHKRGWLASFAANHPTKKAEIDQWVTTILSHREDIAATIEKVPFPPGAFQKQNLIQWTGEFLDDASDYLKGPH